jgi:hypothetical protein
MGLCARANGISDVISFVRDVARLEVRARDERDDEKATTREWMEVQTDDDVMRRRLFDVEG